MGSGMLGSIIANAERNQVHNPTDYIGEDGLLYCGICHTKKQTIITPLQMNPIKVPVVCKCEQEQIDRKREAEEKQRKMENIARLRKMSLIDSKFKEAVFSNFKVNESNSLNLNLCRRYANKFQLMLEKNQGLLFYGNAGTGKSFAAACIANFLLDQGIPVVMTSFVKILDFIQQGGEQLENIILSMNNAQLVIIDDLGAERSTGYALEKVYDIIDSRYRRKLPMILTTNLTLDEMKMEQDIRYIRIYDRIFEVCYPMQFVGDSWRRMQANNRFVDMKKLLSEE